MNQSKNPVIDSTAMRFLVHAMGHISLECNGFDWKGASKKSLSLEQYKDIRDAQIILRGCIRQISFWTARKNRWESL